MHVKRIAVLQPKRSKLRVLVLGLEESRPVVQVMFASRFLSATLLAGHASHDWSAAAVGGSAWLAAAIAVYVFNGVMDIAEDQANGSRRPIASGWLSVTHAATFAAIAASMALACGIAAGIPIPVATFLILGYAYSGPPWPAKRSGPAASAVVVALGLTTFWAGAQVGGGLSRAAILFALIMSGWMGLVGAIVKDLSDVAGDASAGRRTFAVKHGATRTAWWGAALALAVAITGLATALALSLQLVPAMLTLIAGAYVTFTRCTRFARHQETLTRSPYQAFMITQYSTVAILIITIIAKSSAL